MDFEDEDFDLDSDLKPVSDREYVPLTPSANPEDGSGEEDKEVPKEEEAPKEEADASQAAKDDDEDDE